MKTHQIKFTMFDLSFLEPGTARLIMIGWRTAFLTQNFLARCKMYAPVNPGFAAKFVL